MTGTKYIREYKSSVRDTDLHFDVGSQSFKGCADLLDRCLEKYCKDDNFVNLPIEPMEDKPGRTLPLTKHQRRWVKNIEKMRNEGLTWADISKSLRENYNTIAGRYHRYRGKL